MATKTITTYEHSCDLCGEIRDEAELSHLWAPRPGRYGAGGLTYDQMDICANCRNRPIDDALAFFSEKRKAAEADGLTAKVTRTS